MGENVETTISAPVTISFDVEKLITAELGFRTVNRTKYSGDDWDDEPEYEHGDGRLIDVVADKVAAHIESSVKRAVIEAVKERALGKVDALIDEIMVSPIQLTSGMGEPRSPEMTMREAMVKAMTDRLDQAVDSQGKRINRDSYGTRQTYVQWRAEQVARDVFDKDMTARVKEATESIKSAAKDLVSNRIAEALGRAIR